MKKFKSFIIAEVGVNHNGNIEIAKKLINLAKKANCEFVKFQSFKASNLVNQRTRVAKYQKNNLKKKNIKQIDMLKKYQLSYDDHKKLINHCKKKGLNFYRALLIMIV